jgi:hypothetical protein
MLRAILILIVSVSVSACSSQARRHLAEEIAVEVLDIAFDAFVYDTRRDYDEAQIFPSPNQRLACQLDANCKEVLVLYGADHEPWQNKQQTSVPLSSEYQEFLQRQSEVVGHAKANRDPVVFRNPEDLLEPPPLEWGEL